MRRAALYWLAVDLAIVAGFLAAFVGAMLTAVGFVLIVANLPP